jgi:hypothetical protein
MKARTKIKFKLDGHWDGEGIYLALSNSSPNEDELYEVLLTKDCKEFKAGTKIYIFKSEITEMKKSEVEVAFRHVKSLIPEVDCVVYGKDSRWMYIDSTNMLDPISFENVEVDVGILEEASDSLETLPCFFTEKDFE